MNRLEFVKSILTLFGKGENPQIINEYDKALETYKRVDWDKLYQRSIGQISERKLPMPAWFRSQYDYCIAGNGIKANENNGKWVYIELNNGLSYEYEMYNCSKTQAEIRQMINDRFSVDTEKGKKCNVKTIDFFEDYYGLLKFKHNKIQNVKS